MANSYRVTVSVVSPYIVSSFFKLAEHWREETCFQSSVSRKTAHASYRRIVGLGWDVVPLILIWLSVEPEFWFEALTEITGEQPIPKEHAGDMKAMAEDWVAWGRSKGYAL